MKAIAIILVLLCSPAMARDIGQWENSDPAVREWYRTLMQPDAPWVPCCGEADAWYCDAFVRGGKTFCAISDDRPDAPLGRHHVDVGTVISIPDAKLKWDRGNPTGHSIVFLNVNNETYCFVQATGS